MSKAVARKPASAAPAALCLALLCAPWLGPAGAQVDEWVPELPMLQDCGVSARAIGMGGAYLAISDDAAALRYNPAGLARINRIEFSGTLTDIKRDVETVSAGTTLEGSLARTRVTSLGFVYPFPTYRGSMVIALGYSVPWIIDREYRRAWGAAGGVSIDELYDDGTVGEWSFGYAVDVSPTLSLGLRASRIHGSWLRDSRCLQDGAIIEQWSTEYDVDGYTGSLGALARMGNQMKLGLIIDLPRWIHWDPTESSKDGVIRYAKEDLTYPFSAAVGTAVAFGNLLLAGDARYTDWTLIDYKGPMRYLDASGMHDAYRRTWDLHLGAEYLLDVGGAGLRLRAGYAYEPVPCRVLLQDVILAEDPADDQPVYARANFGAQLGHVTLGAGILLQQSVTLDLAYSTGSFGRAVWGLSEEHDERRLLLTAAFRLE
ncbi:MAG: hypothetical protein KAY24_03070 [Candidatus Eisenbacteria sp.]|nr:hypothetical protein [Candidatus Eisenbacteria bacterium]